MQSEKIELSNFFLCVLLCPLKFFYNEHVLTLWLKRGGRVTFTLKERKFKKKQNHVLNLPSSSFYRAHNLCSYLARATQRNEAGVLWSLFNHALITLDSCRKLLLSLTLDFPLGFGGKKHQQTADRKGVGAWKIQSCCCPWQKAEGCGPNDLFVGRELPLL